MSKNILDKSFYYPSRNLGVYWEWPWNVTRGLLSWLYGRWSAPSRDSKQIYSGRTILGFQKITITWNCDPPEAYFIHKQNEDKILARMYEMAKELKKEKECCGKGCGCH